MQNAFLKLALMAALSISSAFAAESDLLSQATSGAISTAKADVSEVKVLSQDEMKDVKGGVNPILVNAGRTAVSTLTSSAYSSSSSRYVQTMSRWSSLIRVK